MEPRGHSQGDSTGALRARGRRRALGGAAMLALAVAGLAGTLWWLLSPPSPGIDDPQRLALARSLASEANRVVDGRISGLAYAPPPVLTRGVVPPAPSPEVRIAAARIDKRARDEDSSRNRAALGVAYLALRDWDRAVEALEDAAQREASSPDILNDLAAAYLARAAQAGRVEDWVHGLAAAERSMALDPARPEPLFNRAIALRGLHLPFEEAEGWRRFQALERSGGWSAEASGRLRELADYPHPPASEDNQTLRERIEDDVLARWGAAVERDDAAAAGELLDEAQRLSRQLSGNHGDAMAGDEVARIRRLQAGETSARRSLARGHQLFAAARARFVDNDIVEAARLMGDAATPLRQGGSPYAAWAPVYAAIAARSRGQSAEALGLLAAIPRPLPPAFATLTARVTWTEALAHGTLGRYDRARDALLAAVAQFRAAGEARNALAAQTILAETEWFLGNRESAWSNLLAVLSLVDDREPTRQIQPFDLAATMALGAGLPESALVFHNALVRLAAVPAFRAEALLRRARTHVRLGHRELASRDLSDAQSALTASGSRIQIDRVSADAESVRAELLSESDCPQAFGHIEAALAYFNRVAGSIRRASLLNLRSRCRARTGDAAGAAADLQDAIALFEARLGGIVSIADQLQAFELERTTFDDLVALQAVEQRDDQAAFATAERARRGILAGVWKERGDDSTAASIPEDVAVVYFESIPDRVLVWVLTRERRTTFERPIPQAGLVRLVAGIQRAISQGADLAALRPHSAPLFDAVIAPALAAADSGARSKPRIVFVPDGPLHGVPFAALPDASGRALLETRTVAVAPSLETFLAASARLNAFEPASVLAVGDGHDPVTSGLPMLPNADREARAVGDLYPRRTVLVGQDATVPRFLASPARVVHFAGHSVLNERYPMLSRMLLARDARAGDVGWLLATDIAAHRFDRTDVAVLATCEGAAGRRVEGEGAVSVARAFFAAGVPAVVASLWPVDDDLQTLVVEFHRALRAERDAAGALRRGQLAILEERGRSAPVRAWGGFIMLGGMRSRPLNTLRAS